MLASVMLAATFGMASCQQDDELFDQQVTTENQKPEEVSDVAFTSSFNFQYDGSGVKSPDQYVQDCDFSLNKDAMEKLRMEGFASDNVGLDILEFIGGKIATAAGGKIGTEIWNLIVAPEKQDDHSKEILDQLSQLQDKVDGLSKMINDLIALSQTIEVSNLYKDRMSKYLDLSATNLDAYTNFFAYLSEGDTLRADSVLNTWATTTVNGSPAPIATRTYMIMLTDRSNSQLMNMAQIYDCWVFHTTPWEHMGYQKREQLRAGDLSIAMTGYLMAQVYYLRHNAPSAGVMIDQMNDAFEVFNKYYAEYGKVIHHDDKRICQIEDAHIVFGKDIIKRDMQDHPWYRWNSEWWFADECVKRLMYGDAKTDALMTPDEAMKIYNFYNSGKEKKTFYEILKDADFNLGDSLNFGPGGPMVMNLDAGAHENSTDQTFETNYDFYYNKVLMLDESEPIRENLRIGRMWIEYKMSDIITFKRYMRRWVDNITPSQYKLFRTDISKRYAGMDPGLDE